MERNTTYSFALAALVTLSACSKQDPVQILEEGPDFLSCFNDRTLAGAALKKEGRSGSFKLHFVDEGAVEFGREDILNVDVEQNSWAGDLDVKHAKKVVLKHCQNGSTDEDKIRSLGIIITPSETDEDASSKSERSKVSGPFKTTSLKTPEEIYEVGPVDLTAF